MNAVLRQTPNILSAIRLFLAPVAAWLILAHEDFAALCVFGFAGLSDAADGFLAKTFGLSSRFGAWLDPAADKLLMLASFCALTYTGAVPLWLTVLVIGRDIAIVVGVLAARALRLALVVAPLTVGKVSTVVQVLYIAMVLLLLVLPNPASAGLPAIIRRAGEAAVTVLALWSAAAYAQVWFKAAFRRASQGDSTT